MKNSKEDIIKEIDMYSTQAKRVKNVVPLITIITLGAGIFFFKDIENHFYIACMGAASIILYVSSFAYAYFRSLSRIKKLNEKLDQLQ